MENKDIDVIIIGGSFAGLSAAMALGRSLRNVLIIDSGSPCNIQTPHSHNFITQDGQTPAAITKLATQQVLEYETVQLLKDKVTDVNGSNNSFEVVTEKGKRFYTKKILFATGMKDIMPDIKGFAECWGISILHCPYCHGYEVANEHLGIIANGDSAYEFAKIISNWSKRITVYTNGKSTIDIDQIQKLKQHQIEIVEKEISEIKHERGQIARLLFKDTSEARPVAIFTRPSQIQHCDIAAKLGCEITETGYIKIDDFQKSSVGGIYAAGDCTSMFRAVSIAIASGTKAGALINKELIEEAF